MLSLLTRPFRRAAVAAGVSTEVVEYGKNPACQEAIAKTNAIIFDGIEIPKPNPSLIEERKIYASAHLDYQIKLCDWRLRCRILKDIGFLEYTFQEAVTLLTGRDVDRKIQGRFSWENSFRWEDDSDKESAEVDFRAGSPDASSVDALAFRRNQPGYALKGTKERVLFGPMGQLRVSIPAGAVLKMMALKERKSGLSVTSTYTLEKKVIPYERDLPLVDEFTVLAPEWCWANPQPKDPILFGMIAGPYNRATKEFDHRLYMLARWE